MDPAVKRRAATRGSVTRAITKIETKLKTTLTLPEVEALQFGLNLHNDNLEQHNKEVHTFLSDQTLDADIEVCADYAERVVEARMQLYARSSSLQSATNQPAAVPSTAHAIPVAAGVGAGMSASARHLPKQELTTFSGDPMNWKAFWDDFNATVHDLTDISEVRKFKYLKQVLKGQALDLVEGLPLSDANYQQAISMLKEQYDDNQLAVFSHFEALLSIREASHDVDQLRSAYNQCEVHVRSLISLGLQEDTYGLAFVPIMLSKMPRFVRVELHRKHGSKKWTLSKLRELIKEEISARDKADRSFMRPKTEVAAQPKYKPSHGPGKAHQASGSALVANDGASKSKGVSCSFCGKGHFTDMCDVYKDLVARMTQMNGRCYCCLGKGHQARQCTRKRNCAYCGKNGHHRSLCREKFASPKTKESAALVDVDENDEEGSELHDTVNAVSVFAGGSRSVMQTALGQIRGPKGQTSARFVFDTAASRSFITRAKAAEIGATAVGEETVSLGRFRENRRSTEKYKLVELEAISHTGEKKKVRFAVSDVITTPIKLYPLDRETQAKLRNVRLAEPIVAEAVSVTVDILLGLDWYFDLIEEHQIRLQNGLVFMSSFFGYVAGGRSSCSGAKGAESNLFTFVAEGSVENFELEKFWSLEDLGIKDSPEINEDELALAKFKETLQFKDKRYQVQWPFKDGTPDIPSNFGLAVGRLKSLLRRHGNDPAVIEKYEKTFQDQLNAGIIEVAPEIPTGFEHYIPHQCVIRKDSNTTKFRVVMDASAKSAGQKKSINQCFYHCPLILTDLVCVILRMRLSKVAVVGDIEKAYLQIGLQETERDCTRFLWIKDVSKPVAAGNLIVYRFVRVPFGFGPSAFLLGGSVDDLLLKEGTIVAMDIRDNIYVDNVFGGRETVAQAREFVREAIRIFRQASMNLREWCSNSQEVVDSLPVEQRGKGATTKVLGLKWDTAADTLSCPMGVTKDAVGKTKRQILKAIATLFDPCGLFAPVTVKAKILMQELWILKIGWDEEVPAEVMNRWLTCSASMQEVPTAPIQRQLQSSVYAAGASVDLHCFCDASTKAYAAAVYARVENDGKITSDLLICKCRVNPVAALPVPRLELMAALVGSRLLRFVEQELRVPIAAKVLWSDSMCTLHWIRGKQTYTRFVENRVKEIRSVQNLDFMYVPTLQNPADLPSRGLSTGELCQARLWWHGPVFLCKPRSRWPAQDILDWKAEISDALQPDNKAEDQENPVLALVVARWEPEIQDQVIDSSRFSSLGKLLRVTAYVFRFVLRERPESKVVTAAELDQALWYWVKITQAESLNELATSKRVRMENRRRQLGVFVDGQGVVRCRGRLQNSDLSYDARNPILLPKNAHFTKLIIQSCHAAVFHSGAVHTLAKVRDKYWIPDGRSTVQKVLRGCVLCCKHQGGPYRIPDPPPLPAFRVSQSRPFSHVGLDYLGPLYVKSECKSSKVWVSLFTCAVTRAIHLEVVSDFTTGEFLMCLRRFMALYGVPDVVVSDNAKQFHAADRIARRMWADVRKSAEVREFVAAKGIQWKFITQLAPWMGGLYERLVSPVKQALKKSLDKRCVTLVELQTLTYEVARVVNSRPLTEIGTEVGVITISPAHFLLRDASHVPTGTERVQHVTGDSAIQDWKRGQRLLDVFWATWRRQYLAELRSRLWSHHQRNTSVHEPRLGQWFKLRTSCREECGGWDVSLNFTRGQTGK